MLQQTGGNVCFALPEQHVRLQRIYPELTGQWFGYCPSERRLVGVTTTEPRVK